MKLIHCSDLHLDSPMETHLSEAQARERNREILATFSRMVSYAQEQAVQAVLIAGDLFDSGRTRSSTVSYVLDIIAQAKDIDFLYLRGNHDEDGGLRSGAALPENLKCFTDSWTTYRYGSLTITGAELTGENHTAIYDSLSLDPADTNIVVLHGQESTQPGPDLVCLPRLRDRHIHYLALGHLHSYREDALDRSGTYCYSGCLEGRGFDECGEKGFVLLEVEGKRIRRSFVPFGKRQLHSIPVDITGQETIPQLSAAIRAATAHIPREDLVKIILTGTYTTQTHKDLDFLRQALAHSFYFLRIKDESTLYLEPAGYEHDVSLKGEFIRTVMASHLTEEEKEQIICAGLLALRGEEIRI